MTYDNKKKKIPLIKTIEDANKKLEESLKLLHAKQESLKLAQEVGHFGSWEIDLLTGKAL